MTTAQSDRLLHRGIWFLIVGVFTSWLLGLGLLFILGAATCAFVGLFGARAWKSALLLCASLLIGGFAGLVALHSLAIVGIYAFSRLNDGSQRGVAPATELRR